MKLNEPDISTSGIEQSGFSLIELMIAISIMVVMALIGSSFIINGLRSTTFEDEQATAVVVARRALDGMAQEIRGANSSEKGDYLLDYIDRYQLIFYADINKDNVTEKVDYFMDGTEIKKALYGPDSDHNYTVAIGTSTVAKYVNNNEEPIFMYYAGNATSTETSQINKVRLIKIVLKINVTPWRAPGDYYVVSSVKLRNVQD